VLIAFLIADARLAEAAAAQVRSVRCCACARAQTRASPPERRALARPHPACWPQASSVPCLSTRFFLNSGVSGRVPDARSQRWRVNATQPVSFSRGWEESRVQICRGQSRPRCSACAALKCASLLPFLRPFLIGPRLLRWPWQPAKTARQEQMQTGMWAQAQRVGGGRRLTRLPSSVGLPGSGPHWCIPQ